MYLIRSHKAEAAYERQLHTVHKRFHILMMMILMMKWWWWWWW